MADFVTPLLAWLNANPEWAGLVTFTISASESVAIIGTIIPGSITMTAIGALAGAGVIPLWETLFFATLGAVVGDGISYWMGYYFKDSIRKMWPFNRNPAILRRGEMFVHKYGIMSVFIGRFIGPVRALVPLVAGMLGMRPLQFTVANVTSAIGWAPAYLLPGMLLGAASMELPPDIALHVILVLLLVLLFISLCVWLTYKLLKSIRVQIENVENIIWQWFKTHPIGRPITIWLAHHNHTKKHGQFSLALLFLLSTLLLFASMFYIKAVGAEHITLNQIGYNFFRSIRNSHADFYLFLATLLGQKEVLIPTTLGIITILLIKKYYRLATHFALLLVATAGSVFVLKDVFQSLRPWGILRAPDTYSMPSGHAALSFAVLLGIGYFAARTMKRNQRRFFVYIPCMLLIFLVGFSRLYLGAHWITDILTGWLLGASVLTFVIISYERQTEKPINSKRLLSIASLFLALSLFGFYQLNASLLQTRYKKADWPILTLNETSWWNTGVGIPKQRTSLFGFPSQRINIQWAGELSVIEQTLQKAGWSKPPARNFISTLHRVADISSTQYLPMVSLQYLDDKPKLVLAKKENGGLLVIRLWDGHRRFTNETATPLWVGIVDRVPRSYSWLFKDSHGEIEINPHYIFPSDKMKTIWEWKIMTLSTKTHDHIDTAKTMLLRQK